MVLEAILKMLPTYDMVYDFYLLHAAFRRLRNSCHCTRPLIHAFLSHPQAQANSYECYSLFLVVLSLYYLNLRMAQIPPLSSSFYTKLGVELYLQQKIIFSLWKADYVLVHF